MDSTSRCNPIETFPCYNNVLSIYKLKFIYSEHWNIRIYIMLAPQLIAAPSNF